MKQTAKKSPPAVTILKKVPNPQQLRDQVDGDCEQGVTQDDVVMEAVFDDFNFVYWARRHILISNPITLFLFWNFYRYQVCFNVPWKAESPFPGGLSVRSCPLEFKITKSQNLELNIVDNWNRVVFHGHPVCATQRLSVCANHFCLRWIIGLPVVPRIPKLHLIIYFPPRDNLFILVIHHLFNLLPWYLKYIVGYKTDDLSVFFLCS